MLKVSEIRDANHSDFRKAIEIYVNSFPPNERHTEEVVKRRLEKGLYKMFAGHLNDKVVAMALIYPLKNTDFILFDYMAVKREDRSKGIGTELVKALLNILRKDLNDKYLILEVENPKYGNNKIERERRVKFYRQFGAKEMNRVNYILPPLSGVTPTEMILMVLPKYKNGKVSKKLVKKIIIQIYKELYNRNEDDPLLKSFINDIPTRVELI